MRILLLLAIAALAVSCRCPQLAIQSSKDSSYVEHKVDTVWIPGKVIEGGINLSYLCDSIYALNKGGEVNLDEIIADGPVHASIKKNVLHIIAPCPPQVTIHDTTTVKQVKTETVTIIKEAEETWWQKMYKWGFWIVIAGLIIAGYIKLPFK